MHIQLQLIVISFLLAMTLAFFSDPRPLADGVCLYFIFLMIMIAVAIVFSSL